MSTNQEFNFPLGDEKRLQNLRKRWEKSIKSVLHQLSIKPSDVGDVTEEWFQRIITMHADSQRHYHTLCHLEEMFQFVDLLIEHEAKEGCLNLTVTHKAIVDLSIFFHDAVYDAKSGTNEEDSAELFKKFVAELISQQEWHGFKTVENFIIATKTHVVPCDMEDTSDERLLLKLFLDADMAVLGKESKAYNHYASLIRLEYIHVPHDLYCDKRAEILQSFIGSVSSESNGANSKHIYASEVMREALEEIAISNLRREIDSLKKREIPGTA